MEEVVNVFLNLDKIIVEEPVEANNLHIVTQNDNKENN